MLLDNTGRATAANNAWTTLVGLTVDQTVSDGWLEAIHPSDRGLALGSIRSVVTNVGALAGEWRLTATDDIEPRSVAVHLRAAGGDDVLAVLWETTAWRQREAELLNRATHDSLTGLLTRDILADRARHALDRLARRAGTLGLMFVDLDGFKAVNDRFGHAVGDRVLAGAAANISSAIRPSDSAARIGGDEFAVLCEDFVDTNDATTMAHRVLESVRARVEVGGKVISIGASVGIAFAHGPDDSVEALLDRADRALYVAKQRGGQRHELAAGDEHAFRVVDLTSSAGTRQGNRPFAPVGPGGSPFSARCAVREQAARIVWTGLI